MRIAIITGASKGIGRATAALFLEKEYHVINLSRTNPEMDGLVHIPADLGDASWVPDNGQKILDAINEKGDPDEICLIHNAAMMAKDDNESVQPDIMQQTFQLNVIAATQLNQLLLPHMKSGSSILYVASTLAEKAVGGTCSYTVSKHAQLGLMRTTCQDLFGRNIHTAAVCPGLTDTEMLRNHCNNDEAILADMASLSSYNRLVKPEEIAYTLFFCAQNPAINGSTVHANLGQRES
jgi:NAD(P)-dependent dehydrogenase (short-subunit alcohol dehydrogenase family)